VVVRRNLDETIAKTLANANETKIIGRYDILDALVT
jgi:hypothetical protein